MVTVPEEQKVSESAKQEPPPPADRKGGEKLDSDIARWIKNLGAVVTILVALFGVWQAFRQLKDKAEADRRTAELNEESERIKLKIAEEQIRAQDQAAERQERQHEKDSELEYRKHLGDIRRQESDAAEQRTVANQTALATVINHMFGAQGSAEGDLSVLFNFVRRDEQSKEIIENAVLARLESPHSSSEIEVCFRLLENIGSSSLEFMAEANRSARRRYDDYLIAAYRDALPKIPPRQKKPGRSSDRLLGAALDATHESTLDRAYAMALLNSQLLEPTDFSVQHGPLSDTEVKERQMGFRLSQEVIHRSNIGIVNVLKSCSPADGKLDMSDTYLTHMQTFSGVWECSLRKPDFKRAYIELDSYSMITLKAAYPITFSVVSNTEGNGWPK